MIVALIEGFNRICGKSQGFLGLPVRDVAVEDKVMGLSPFMVTAWTPTPEELERLNNGASVHVWINGTSPPPMHVEVGEARPMEGG